MTERSELATFLRARREQLRPEEVGLRSTGRRRTPGLRREEVATLAGVSVDYLIRIEQGRDLKPSPSVISALGAALKLSDAERTHLARLAAINGSPEMCPGGTALNHDVAPTVQLIIDRLEPTPAFVLGPVGDVLAANSAWRTLVQPLGFIDDTPPNLPRYVFTHPQARNVFTDWSRAADEQVSRLRSAAMRWSEEEHFAMLVHDLSTSTEFATRWSTHNIADKQRGFERIMHPTVGELRFLFESLQLPDDGEQRIITWLPADDATDAAVRHALAGAANGTAHLRVVREA